MGEIKHRHRVDLTVYLDFNEERTQLLASSLARAIFAECEVMEQELKTKLGAEHVSIIDFEAEEIPNGD